MLDADPKNSDVIFPYLNGSDLNSDPYQSPSRFVINFWDWSEERAKTYLEPYERVLSLVKPIREKLNRAKYRDRWWHYSEAVPNLYHTIGFGHSFQKHPDSWNPALKQADRVLVVTRVSKTLAFSFVRTGIVFSDATVVFRWPEIGIWHYFSLVFMQYLRGNTLHD